MGIHFVKIKKNERGKYPTLKTLYELKKMGLQPRKRVKPRGWYEPYHYHRWKSLLYDVALTEPYKMTDRERELRKKAAQRRKVRLDQKKRRKRGLELIEKAVPTQKVVFDIETTGLDPMNDEILQFSAINGEGEVLLNTYVRPVFHECWPNAERINGITPDMVANAPTFSEVWEDIQAIFLSASELISYNGIFFDAQFLATEGIVFPNVQHYDVMLEFAPLYGEWSPYHEDYKWQKLTTCACYYGYTFKAHDSLEDVRATLYCYNKIQEDDEVREFW